MCVCVWCVYWPGSVLWLSCQGHVVLGPSAAMQRARLSGELAAWEGMLSPGHRAHGHAGTGRASKDWAFCSQCWGVVAKLGSHTSWWVRLGVGQNHGSWAMLEGARLSSLAPWGRPGGILQEPQPCLGQLQCGLYLSHTAPGALWCWAGETEATEQLEEPSQSRQEPGQGSKGLCLWQHLKRSGLAEPQPRGRHWCKSGPRPAVWLAGQGQGKVQRPSCLCAPCPDSVDLEGGGCPGREAVILAPFARTTAKPRGLVPKFPAAWAGTGPFGKCFQGSPEELGDWVALSTGLQAAPWG